MNILNLGAGVQSTALYLMFDLEMTRGDCIAYLQSVAPDRTVARSACVYCPYRRNAEWRRLRDEDPDGWQLACKVDDGMRHPDAICGVGLERKLYLHRSCVPLSIAPIDEPESADDQMRFGFSQECEGMCGL